MVVENTRNLEFLRLDECKIDLNHLKLLTKLSPNIKTLYLHEQVNNEGFYGDEELKILSGLKELKNLTIEGTLVEGRHDETYCKTITFLTTSESNANFYTSSTEIVHSGTFLG